MKFDQFLLHISRNLCKAIIKASLYHLFYSYTINATFADCSSFLPYLRVSIELDTLYLVEA